VKIVKEDADDRWDGENMTTIMEIQTNQMNFVFIMGMISLFILITGFISTCSATDTIENPDENTTDIMTNLDIESLNLDLNCPSELHYCCAVGRNVDADTVNLTINLTKSDGSFYSDLIITNADVDSATHETDEYCVNSSGTSNNYGAWTCFAEVEYNGNTSNDSITKTIYSDICGHDDIPKPIDCYVVKHIEEKRCVNESPMGSGEYIWARVQYKVTKKQGSTQTTSNLANVNLTWNLNDTVQLNCVTNDSGWCDLYFPTTAGDYQVDVDVDDLSDCDNIYVNESWNFTVDDTILDTCDCNETRDVEIIYNSDPCATGNWNITLKYKGDPAPSGSWILIDPCPPLSSETTSTMGRQFVSLASSGETGIGDRGNPGVKSEGTPGCRYNVDDSGNVFLPTPPASPGSSYNLQIFVPNCSIILSNVTCPNICSNLGGTCNDTIPCCSDYQCVDNVCVEKENNCIETGYAGCNDTISCCDDNIPCTNGTCCIPIGSDILCSGDNDCCGSDEGIKCNLTSGLCYQPENIIILCNDSVDCPSGMDCVEGECKKIHGGVRNETKNIGLGKILGINKTCLFGDCSPEALRNAAEQGWLNKKLIFRNGCAGLFLIVNNWIICDVLWMLLVLLALLATWVWRRKKLKDVEEKDKDTEIKPIYKSIPYITLILPLLIGFLTFVWIGIVVAVFEILIRIAGLRHIKKYDETLLNKNY